MMECSEENVEGVEREMMMELNGFVSETKATNVFITKEGEIMTPFADACLPGLTRKLILGLCRDDGVPVREKNLSMTEMYNADEVFTTGTMGELTPVLAIDGRCIGDGKPGDMTGRLSRIHGDWVRKHGEELPF